MEKKYNGMFKAVSVISLVLAIIFSVSSALLLLTTLIDFESFALTFIEEGTTNISPEMISDVRLAATIYMVVMGVYMLGSQILLYISYNKFKFYSNLTNEEASKYNGKIIAWIVFHFICSGLLLGILSLVGYLTVTKGQVEQYRGIKDSNQEYNNENTHDQNLEQNNDLDKMMERLERLQKIRDMGGITEEEYQALRSKIINK